MYNRAILIGRITKEIEMKYSNNNKAIANFTLAVNRPYAKSGDTNADFIRCVLFGKAAENLNKYTKKGSLISVEGSIQISNYQKDGKTMYSTQVVCGGVVFLDTKNNKQEETKNDQTKDEPNENHLEDDSPF